MNAAEDFTEAQARCFVEYLLSSFGYSGLEAVPSPSGARELPVMSLAGGVAAKTSREAAARFWSADGVVAYELPPSGDPRITEHPLLALAERWASTLPLRYPVTHPAETDPEAERWAGPWDGTAKVFDSPSGGELAHTASSLPPHFDASGMACSVLAFGLHADRVPPGVVPVNYFQNLVHASLSLARSDWDAFRALFHPQAFSMRWRGLRIQRPILFLNGIGEPQAWYRQCEPEAEVSLRRVDGASERASDFIVSVSQPLADGSTFLRLEKPGMGCIVNNAHTLHSRSGYISDQVAAKPARIVARKWWAATEELATFRVCPGTYVDASYRAAFPTLFPEEEMVGWWSWDAVARKHRPIG